jgi:hypothetical protein
VLRGNDYLKYRGRYEMPPGEDVNVDLFNCAPKASQRSSSEDNDSANAGETYIYDIDGNPIPKSSITAPSKEGDLYTPDQEDLEFIIDE